MRLGTVALATEQTFTIGYVPEYVGVLFAAAADLETIVVNVGGRDFLLRLTGAQFLKQAQLMCMGALKATNVIWIPVADGLITGEQTNITVKAGAAAVQVFVASNNKGTCMFSTLTDTVLANASQEYSKFTTLIVDNPTANDKYSVVTPDGVTQELLAVEVQSFGQMEWNNSTDITCIDNTEQEVSSVILYPDTNRTVIVHRILPSSLAGVKKTIEKLNANRIPVTKANVRKYS